jgi:hypothetical protein
VAQVAAVATVAQVAPVAAVAAVARPGTMRSPEGRRAEPAWRGDAVPLRESAAVPTTNDQQAPMVAAAYTRAGRDLSVAPQDGSERGAREAVQPRASEDATEFVPLESFAASPTPGDTMPELVPHGAREREEARGVAPGMTAPVERTDATERIARALRLQESAGERPVSSVTLRLENPDGGEDRIRVDLRGRSIGATLDVADLAAADHLRSHTNELQQALERRGMDGERIVVRTTGDAASAFAGAAAADREARPAASSSTQTGFTPRDQRGPRDQHATRDHDQPASRQRRDQGAQR